MLLKLWSKCKLLFSVTFVCLPANELALLKLDKSSAGVCVCVPDKHWMVTRRLGVFGGLMSQCIVSISAEAESDSRGWCHHDDITHTRWSVMKMQSAAPHHSLHRERDGWEGWLLLQTRPPLCLHLLVHAGTAQELSQRLDSTAPPCGTKVWRQNKCGNR